MPSWTGNTFMSPKRNKEAPEWTPGPGVGQPFPYGENRRKPFGFTDRCTYQSAHRFLAVGASCFLIVARRLKPFPLGRMRCFSYGIHFLRRASRYGSNLATPHPSRLRRSTLPRGEGTLTFPVPSPYQSVFGAVPLRKRPSPARCPRFPEPGFPPPPRRPWPSCWCRCGAGSFWRTRGR